jgi:formate dehydrogenase subunit gamma
MSRSIAAQVRTGAADRVLRHAAVDRWLHWLMALCVLVLLATAFLPIVGIEFPWVTVHWVAGLSLALFVILHTIRSLGWKRFAPIWFSSRDLDDLRSLLEWHLRRSSRAPAKPGKYSIAQKLIHHCFAAAVLTTVATGLLMLAKIDTPWWDRNPYFLSDRVWGAVYVLHDFAALMMITMVMTHVYFALRPEKLVFLRAMIFGWITRQEFEGNHDPTRWRVD